MLPLQTLHNKRQTSVTASSAVSGRESERKKMERERRGEEGEKNWVCHRAIPPLDMLPQKQMYGVNTAWITAPGR